DAAAAAKRSATEEERRAAEEERRADEAERRAAEAAAKEERSAAEGRRGAAAAAGEEKRRAAGESDVPKDDEGKDKPWAEARECRARDLKARRAVTDALFGTQPKSSILGGILSGGFTWAQEAADETIKYAARDQLAIDREFGTSPDSPQNRARE